MSRLALARNCNDHSDSRCAGAPDLEQPQGCSRDLPQHCGRVLDYSCWQAQCKDAFTGAASQRGPIPPCIATAKDLNRTLFRPRASRDAFGGKSRFRAPLENSSCTPWANFPRLVTFAGSKPRSCTAAFSIASTALIPCFRETLFMAATILCRPISHLPPTCTIGSSVSVAPWNATTKLARGSKFISVGSLKTVLVICNASLLPRCRKPAKSYHAQFPIAATARMISEVPGSMPPPCGAIRRHWWILLSPNVMQKSRPRICPLGSRSS